MLIVVSLALRIPIIISEGFFKVTFKALKHNMKANYEELEWEKKRSSKQLWSYQFFDICTRGTMETNFKILEIFQSTSKALGNTMRVKHKRICQTNLKVTKMLIGLLLNPKGVNFNFLDNYENHFESLGKHCEGHL